jgi:transglutaminase-like putative cysteine protease
MERTMIDRREFLITGAAVSAVAAMTQLARADALFAPDPGEWRSYDIVTRLELADGAAAARAWVPLPGFTAADWNRPGKTKWTANAAKAVITRDKVNGAKMLFVEWKPGGAAPVVEITSRVAIRDRAVNFAKPLSHFLPQKDRAFYLRATERIPTDGIVKAQSDKIVGSATRDLDKARLIYDWVVENTFRDPKTRGCGSGDIASLLKSGHLGGKCADINALYIGLARAAGLPARDLYGLRVAPSKFGYKSLGANSDIVSKAQHCRAEVFLSDFGWLPADPADVRKVMLEEAEGDLSADDPRVAAVREKLFGAWEGNWFAYNSANDVTLPYQGPKVAFLMYPQADVASVPLDCLDPDTFKYTIRASAVAA